MTSLTQSIPDKEALLVDYPGFVRNPDAAIQTLGGLEAISAASNGSSPVLSLHFRPGDPLSHPLLGYKQNTHGLILRISRKAGAANGANEELQAEVVAHVKSAVRFPGMADFQYVSCDTRPLHEQVLQQEGPPGLEAEPMLFPPPLFTKQDVPMDYAFRSYYGGDPDYIKPAATTGRGAGRLAAHVINFQAVNVLPPLSDAAAEEAGLYKDRKLVLRAFSALLAERPIWSGAALKERVSEVTNAEFDIMLPRIAYMFRNGPWKGLWVRRGYDPRSKSASKKYQAIEYRGVERRAEAASTPAGASYKDVASFAALPSGLCILQLCDLDDDHIQGFIEGPAQLESCSIESGWFSSEVWDELQERVKARFAALHAAPPSGRGPARANAAMVEAEPQAAAQPRATASRQDGAQGASTAADHALPSEGAPQQPPDASTSAQDQPPPARPDGLPAQVEAQAGGAQTAGAVDGAAEQPAGAEVSMATDVSGAEGVAARDSVQHILPAMYLQSVLDSWQAEGPAPVAPSAAQLLAASGGDEGDFEIFEGSDEEEGEEAAGVTDDDLGLDEEAQIHDEAEDSDEYDGGGRASADEAEGTVNEGASEEDEEESDQAEEDKESDMHDEDMEEAYNEDDEDG